MSGDIVVSSILDKTATPWFENNGGIYPARDFIFGNQINGPSAEDLIAVFEQRQLIGPGERQMVMALAGRFRSLDMLDLGEALRELERAVDIARNVIVQGEHGRSGPDFISEVRARVAGRMRNNDLDGGAREIEAALAALERQEQRQQWVPLLEDAVKLDILRRDAGVAAGRLEQIVLFQTQSSRPAWHEVFRARLVAYIEEGQLRGINMSAEIAAEMAGRMFRSAGHDEERALALNLAGHAMLNLGRRGVGVDYLTLAVQTYREAVAKQSRGSAPMVWAKYQSNLGNALSALAERETGLQGFEDAVAAYTAALEERPRDRATVDWAKTQLNMANALRQLGERQDGHDLLARADLAYRATLEVFTPMAYPDHWATAQSGLGAVLLCRGERDSDIGRLTEAATAFGAALRIRTRHSAPQKWAYAQNGLATAWKELGQRDHAPNLTRDAVAAYRSVLDVWTRDSAPDLWAGVQINLGHALRTLSENDAGTSCLQEAVEADRNALSHFTQNAHGQHWAMAQNGLGYALLEWAKRDDADARLERAVQAFQAALGVWTPTGDPACYRQAQSGLQCARRELRARRARTDAAGTPVGHRPKAAAAAA